MNLFSVKQELGGFMERFQGLAEMEKMRLEEELRSSRKECEDMKKKIKSVEESKDSEIMVLRNKLLASYEELDKLRQENIESARFAEDLKFQKMEAEKAAEFIRTKFVDLEKTIVVMEVKVDDLEKMVKDDENVVVKSPVVGSNCGSADLAKRVHASSETVLNSQCAQSDHNPQRTELENTKHKIRTNGDSTGLAKRGGEKDFNAASKTVLNPPLAELEKTKQGIKIEGLEDSDTVKEKLSSVSGCTAADGIIIISDSDDETDKRKRTEKFYKRKRNTSGSNGYNTPIEGGYCNLQYDGFNTVGLDDDYMESLMQRLRDTKERIRK